jgi:hypothetical protein
LAGKKYSGAYSGYLFSGFGMSRCAIPSHSLLGSMESIKSSFSGGISTKIRRFSYYETYEEERSSYLSIWAATKKFTAYSVNF